MSESVVDLRSDTVTMPTAAMIAAMVAAPLGDDVLGDDPSVRALEGCVADRLGKESACYVPSGTMANVCALRTLTEPGDEIIAEEQSHIAHYEGGAYAAICGCAIRFIRSARGVFGADEIAPLVRPNNDHFPRSRVVVVENTHNFGGGTVWPMDELAGVCEAARSHGLLLHMDGARLWNASVAAGVEPAAFAEPFDTVSVCFSKGLGAPVGSCVVGDAARIAKARRVRKMLGGAMRQSGLLAAGAQHALENQYDRLAEDHRNAARLAEGLGAITGVNPRPVETNIVFFDVPGDAADLCVKLEAGGVRMYPTGAATIRAVTHLGVSGEQIERAIDAVGRAVAESR